MAVAAPRLEVDLLGRFEIHVDGRPVSIPSRAAQSLFAYLIFTAGTAHRREKLAGMFWPDADDESARSYLRHALWRIRKSVASSAGPGVDLIVADDIAVTFSSSVPYCLDAADAQRSADTRDELLAITARYGGELLPGFLDEWTVRERERLAAIFDDRMERLLCSLIAGGQWERTIEHAERWISLAAAPEAAFRALMEAHAAGGDRGAIATTYQRCAHALRSELDVDPSPETRAAYERLTMTRTAPLLERPPARRAPAPGNAPFKGLLAFEEEDAALFFGRERLVERIAERLARTRFLAVVGASGSGKSSVIRAGVIPRIRHERRDAGVVLLTPTAHPLEALAHALGRAGEGGAGTTQLVDNDGGSARPLSSGTATLIVVDQFEEVFTACRDAFERELFIEEIVSAANSAVADVTVLIGVRADFYAHCADHRGLRELLVQHQELIGPMTADELRIAIEAPATGAGWDFEPGLVDLLASEVADEPGALPLLSHALLETWRRRVGHEMTLAGYIGSGGVRGAIARTADAVFEAATDPERALLRQVFVRLTELGESTQDTRRRVLLDELLCLPEGEDAVAPMLHRLADARLVTIDGRTVDVAHEALIREWPRLRTWLEEDREAVRAHRELTRAALEWDRSGRDASLLFRGRRLSEAAARLAVTPHEGSALERTFLEASRRAEVEQEVERISTARALRRRAVYLAVSILAIAAMAGATVYFAQSARAAADAAVVEQRRALVESARAGAVAVANRIDRLRTAIGTEDMQVDISRVARRAADGQDTDLRALLGSLRRSAGPDASMLFVTQYLNDVVLGVDIDPSIGPYSSARIHAARTAFTGTVPTFVNERCPFDFWLPNVLVSTPYPAPPNGELVIALAQYGPRCVAPYGVVFDMSVARAREWLAPALAPTDDAYLVDAIGRLVARTRREAAVLLDLASTEVVRSAMSTHDAFVIASTDPIGGVPVMAAAAPVGNIGWRVIVLRPLAVARAQDSPDGTKIATAATPLGAVTAAVLVALLAVRVRRGALRPTTSP